MSSRNVNVSKTFLKQHYGNHISRNDGICFNGLEYSLTKENQDKSCTLCSICKF